MNPKRVLVIDNEETIRTSFRRAWKETPHRVDTAESGEQGDDPGGLIFNKLCNSIGAGTLLPIAAPGAPSANGLLT